MGLKRKDAWTEEEDEVLRELYPRFDTSNRDEILSKINRTWGAIRRRAKQLGLSRGNYIPPLERLPPFNPSKEERVWLACAIDCEGTITISRRKRLDLALGYHLLPFVSFCNSHRGIVRTFRNLTFQNLRVEAQLRPPWKTKYAVNIRRQPQIYAFLKAIRDFLIVKQRQADLVIEFIEIENSRLTLKQKYRHQYTERQLEIVEEVWKLNA